MGKLFIELLKGDWFHFGNVPERQYLKSDHSHYISPEGRRKINPLVLVFKIALNKKSRKSIFDQMKGDPNVGTDDHTQD
jgi:hypothetical protein